MAGTEWSEGPYCEWLQKNDAGLGRCYVCQQPFKLGESVAYETPNYPRKWIVKVARHTACKT